MRYGAWLRGLIVVVGTVSGGGVVFGETGYEPYVDSAKWKPVTRMPARVGDRAPDIELLDIVSSRTVRLSDFKGRVVYLDFWATWCPGCQPLMDKMNKLAAGKPEWKGKVAIAGISVDKELKTARRAVESSGWTAMGQLWSGMDLSGREVLASKAYGIVELPYAVIIDWSGKVAWRGDPQKTSAEELIGKLLDSKVAPPAP